MRRAAATFAVLVASTLGLLTVAHLDALRAPGVAASVSAELTAIVTEVDEVGAAAPTRLVPLAVIGTVVIGLAVAAAAPGCSTGVERSALLPSPVRAAPRRRRAPPS